MLSISHNRIPELPGSIGNLMNLVDFFMNDNLIDRIPPEIVNLVLLKHFTYTGNPLTMPPVADLKGKP